jgi:release factor glutamine methyltransferase
VEADPGAIPWLKSNATRGAVHVHEADVTTCLPHLDRQVDVVIANPPYIPADAVPRDLEVARYDPEMALYSGSDGLNHMRMVEEAARRLLKPSGWAVVEHGDLQGASAPRVFSEQPEWTAVQDHVDFNGRDRFFVAQRSAVS